MADLGEISGQVKAPHMDWTQAIVQARPVRGQMVYETLVRPGETYQMDYLPDGFYLLTTIIDRNENTQWDKGQTDPWRFAERFLFRPDTVKVRKRWTTQGIDFNFK